MAYISLFRKYRSENFEDLVGQDHIVKTISNSIKSNKIAQGYLFCGTRGTGKTTVARIIAKALNCEHGPTDHPCGVCPICQSIKDGSCIDVIEMDAASNRSVEDVERIVDSVRYKPTECRYKVYIIDEAHQLSNQAKDAFLKTLEEPPEYVVFILATTESHKIPVTIRSRCQQFDFKRGSIEEISHRVKYVANQENVEIGDDAVNIIARNANGSYRDSLSILEQIISFSGNIITPAEVYSVLGLVEEDVLFKMSEAIIKSDIKQAFEFGSDLIDRGKDIKEVLNNVATFYRDLLSVKINAYNYGIRYKNEAENYSEKQLVDIIDIFANAQKDLRLSDQQRLTFELAFLKAIESIKQKPSEVQVQYVMPPVVKVAENVSTNETQPIKRQPLRVIQNQNVNIESQKDKDEKNLPKRVIDFDKHIRGFWKRYVNYIKEKVDTPLGKCLEFGVPTSYENEVLTITFQYDKQFQLEYCKNKYKKLEEVLLQCYNIPMRVKLVFFPKPPEPTNTINDNVIATPPDFSEDIPTLEDEPLKENHVSDDLEEINKVTIDNSSLNNIEKKDNISSLIDDEIKQEKEELSKDLKLESSLDVLSESPLLDVRYEDHPKLEEIKLVFPDAEIEKTVNN